MAEEATLSIRLEDKGVPEGQAAVPRPVQPPLSQVVPPPALTPRPAKETPAAESGLDKMAEEWAKILRRMAEEGQRPKPVPAAAPAVPAATPAVATPPTPAAAAQQPAAVTPAPARTTPPPLPPSLPRAAAAPPVMPVVPLDRPVTVLGTAGEAKAPPRTTPPPLPPRPPRPPATGEQPPAPDEEPAPKAQAIPKVKAKDPYIQMASEQIEKEEAAAREQRKLQAARDQLRPPAQQQQQWGQFDPKTQQQVTQKVGAVSQAATAGGGGMSQGQSMALQGLAAGGPIGAVVGAAVGAVEDMKKEFREAAELAKNMAVAIGSADTEKFERGLIEMGEKIPYVGKALGWLAGSVLDVSSAIDQTSRRLSIYDAGLARQQAELEVRSIYRDLDRAQRMGPQLERATQARADFDAKIQDAIDRLLPIIATGISRILETVNRAEEIAKGVLEMTGTMVQFLSQMPLIGGATQNLMDRVREILQQQLGIMTGNQQQQNNAGQVFVQELLSASATDAQAMQEQMQWWLQQNQNQSAPIFPAF